jgi:hypothetical protein
MTILTMNIKNINYVILALIAVFSGLSFWGQPAFDPDLGWHLFGGEEISRTARVPTFDLINSFSTRWHDYHWLAQIVFYLIYDTYSYQGLSITLGVICACFSIIILGIASQQKILTRSPIITILALLFCLSLMIKVTSVRPQIIALTFLALSLYRLKNKPSYIEPLLLFVYTVIVANMHVYWVFVPFIYLFYRIIPSYKTYSRKSFYSKLLILILLSSAALFSPYGFFAGPEGWILENYALIFDYLMMPEAVSKTIGELQSSFSSGGTTPFLLCIALAIFVRGFSKSDLRNHLPDFLVSLISFLLAIRATKFLAVFALLSFPYFLLCLYRVSRPFRKQILAPGRIYSPSVLAFILISVALYCGYRFPDKELVTSELQNQLPIKACQYIAGLNLKPNEDHEHIRVLTHFNYGGWCRWIMKQEAPMKDLRVTTDGRTQWFPPEFFTKAIDLYNARFDWLKTLKEWNPEVLLVQRDKPLANVLALAKGEWKLEYHDQMFAVFLPVR